MAYFTIPLRRLSTWGGEVCFPAGTGESSFVKSDCLDEGVGKLRIAAELHMVRLVRDSIGLVPERGVEERRRRALYRKVSAYDGDWLKLLGEKPDARRLRVQAGAGRLRRRRG